MRLVEMALTDLTPAGMWVLYLLDKKEPRTVDELQAESAKARIDRGELQKGLSEVGTHGYAVEGSDGWLRTEAGRTEYPPKKETS